jgi:hypothetical protein
MVITNTAFQDIEVAITAYSDEQYTEARKLNSTGLVSSSADIDTTMESFIGQMRWYKTIDANFNTPSLVTPTDGTVTDVSTEVAKYIKSMQSFGARQVNLQKVVTQEDGLEKVARDFSELQSQNEDAAVKAVLTGVAGAETGTGITGGIVGFDTEANATTGMFVDMNAAGAYGAVVASAANGRRLFDSSVAGAARGERLFRAIGMGFKDYEPDWAYMVTTPETMADLRAANLVDDTTVTDGNLEFATIFGGKFRLIQSRWNQGDFSSASSLNTYSKRTTFIVKPGAIVWNPIQLEMPTEIDRNAKAYLGGGTTEIWYRWGYVAHPRGYSWSGAENVFANPASLAAGASWERKYDPLNLSILPIFHS